MKLQNQVCTVAQAQKLAALGIDQKSYFTWGEAHMGDNRRDDYNTTSYWMLCRPNTGEYEIAPVDDTPDWWDGEDYGLNQVFAAFTVAELGQIVSILADRGGEMPEALYEPDATMSMIFSAPFLAKQVIGLLESGAITAAEVNARLAA